jgi:hypothetical protein
MRVLLGIFSVLLCGSLCLDEPTIALLASPRATLVYILALWLRCEWSERRNDKTEAKSKREAVKENYELSQTVLNLSEQHRLLCEIRNAVLKSLRYSKDTFAELRFPSAMNRAFDSASYTPPKKSPESKSSEPRQLTPPLATEADQVLKAKAALRRGSMSETGISLVGGKRSREMQCS